MKALILGGTRYFGKRLVDLLLNDGHTVTVASTGKTPVQYIAPVERILIDRKNEASMRSAFSGRTWDLVYDQICFNAEEAQIAVNIFSGHIARLIFTSSQSVYDYGEQINEATFDATTYKGNPSNENRYQEGKRLAEQVYTTQNEFSVTAVRFPVVMGPDDHTRRLHWHIARIKFEYPIFFPNPAGKLTIISSEASAEFLNSLAHKELNGPINACSPDPLCLDRLVKTIEEVSGKTLISSSVSTPAEQSPYGVEKNWCASPELAISMGFVFSKVADWVPLLVQQEINNVILDDGKIHKLGY